MKPLVTTSWDDGHPSDLKVAELLRKYGLRGTFYVAFNGGKGPEIDPGRIRDLHDMGMEIGSHTWHHRLLTRLDPAAVIDDLRRSKAGLEDIVSKEVTSLSYPEGVFSPSIVGAVGEAAYRVARTTIEFATSARFDPKRMPITLEFAPRSRLALVRHALRDANVRGLLDWALVGRLARDPAELAGILFERVRRCGGVFHLYARSWQIDERGLWGPLEALLARIAGHAPVRYLTNGEVPGAVAQADEATALRAA